jgi:hypothetical protein
MTQFFGSLKIWDRVPEFRNLREIGLQENRYSVLASLYLFYRFSRL